MSSPPEHFSARGMEHLDEMTCLLYVERQLERGRALEVSAHTQECDACRTLLQALERESRLLTRAMLEEEEPLPARLGAFRERAKRSMQWVWLLSFGLAASGVYALYTSYVEPLQQRLEEAGFGGSSLLGLLIFQGAFWKGWQAMVSLIEVLAVVTLGIFAAVLLRRRMKRGSAMAVLLAGLCALLAMPMPAAASEFRKGESAEVRRDEVVQGDVFLTGDRMRVEGTVKGDVFAFGRALEVPGHVEGDVIVFAQSARITGQVDGNIRGFNNNITVTGTVGRSITEFCETLTIESQGKIGGSATAFVNSFTMDGQIGRDILAFSGQMFLTGSVVGDVRAKGRNLDIASSARVDGRVRFEGEHEPSVASGAKLAFPVEYTHYKSRPEYTRSRYYFWRLLWTCAFILYGLVLIHLFPEFSKECVGAAQNAGASLGLGLLVCISLPIAAVLACVTIVGSPLGILAFLVWLVTLFSAQIVFGGLIGRWILGPAQDAWGQVGRMALGLAIIGVIVPIIHQVELLEFLVKLAVVLWGFGAISLALFRRFQPPSSMATAGVAPATPLPAGTTVGGGPAA